ncbi:hypothetical protein QQZ08_006954 [Neonectria magnoliae]|uniref:Major facilitator superfamily (MFS) profile domain-containing protein n=1 Tax=Neonectria magnoliae TaxID=2732573 RepID=A0ABR1HZF5_9HYPO
MVGAQCLTVKSPDSPRSMLIGSLMNGLQSLHQWREYFGHPAGEMLGLVNAAQSIGSVLALPFVGTLSDQFGWKPILLAGIILITIASILQAASVNYAMLVVSRVIVGFGGMFVVQPSPMLIAELAFPTHRGKYTSAFWIFHYLGAILASWTTFGTQAYQSTVSWRLPESPRWLVAQDRTHEAAAVLTKTSRSRDGNSPLVRHELSEIIGTIHHEKAAKTTGWSALVSTPENRKRTIIALCTGAPAQWNGIRVVLYYLTLVLDTVGITDTFDQALINGLLQIFNFGVALSSAFLVDRLGRRTLFLWSGLGMLVSYVVWTACSVVNSETGNKPAEIVVVVCLFAFFFPETKGYSLEEIARIFDGDDALPKSKARVADQKNAKEVADSASHCETV